MRVLVCGGRDFWNREAVFSALDGLHAEKQITTIIEGEQSGADTLGKRWAKERGVEVLPFAAEWTKYGRPAGPMRNGRMLQEGKPDLVVAFPGHNGTADMVRRAKAAGVEVKAFWEEVKI